MAKPARRRRDPEARRADLLAAAKRVFHDKGVAGAAVSDIVRAAGVAQGTFYLYFENKDALINALADEMVDGLIDAIEAAASLPNADAVAKMLGLRDAILALTGDESLQELAAVYHRPENRAVHERMVARVTPRVLPLVERIVRQGVEERLFIVDDVRVAALFVLGGLHQIEDGVAAPGALPGAIATATVCALRALGHDGSTGVAT
jgi:AcrR family transcriptional regulator